MKVTFVAIGSEQLSISLLSAIAKREGHEVSLAFSAGLFHDRFNLEIPWLAKFFDDTEEVLQKIEELQPDVIAFSVITSTYQWSLEIARQARIRVPHLKTVFGGVHISAVPDRVMNRPEVDYVVVGEGEIAFPQILKAIELEDFITIIPNTRFRDMEGKIVRGPQVGFNQELDSLPAYDKTIWEEYIRIEDKYMTMASRGCPYRCTFCFNNFFAELPEGKRGKYVRLRSAEHMMNELRAAKKRYPGLRAVDFQDDIFTTSKDWLKEFLPMYKEEIALPFQCLTHPQYMNDEIAYLLKDAGCIWVQMGVQTMDEDYKKKSLRRYERSDNVREASRAMNRVGLRSKFDHMLGLPGEPVEAQAKALELYKLETPNRIQVYWTSFLPGTEIMKEGLEQGIIDEAIVDRLNEGIDFYFFRNLDNIKNPALIKLYFAYEVLFRTLPILPAFIRKRIEIRHVSGLPKIFARIMMYTADLITGFWGENMDFYAYFRYYTFNVRRFITIKLGWTPPIATRVKDKAQPLYQIPLPKLKLAG
jgi:anaerobic magnesium-protoporphyrin IX monomethyl ester cyclase